MVSTVPNSRSANASLVLWYPASAVEEGAGHELGVAQRVGDAVGAERILEVPGVSDQCPARSPRLPQVSGHAREAAEVLWRPRRRHPFGRRR